MTHTSQSPSLIMQTRDGANRKELQGIVKVCIFILCLVLCQDLMGSKCIMHTIVYHSYSS